MMDELNHDHIGAMLDTCPMILENKSPSDYLREFGDKLIHVHFIDGTPRGHLAWGDGILDMEKDTLNSLMNMDINTVFHWKSQMQDI